MKQTFFEHHLNHTGREDMIKITSFLKEDLRISGIRDGIAVIHSPHTTAGITVNENADPDVSTICSSGLTRYIHCMTKITATQRVTPMPT